jgi:hypothetical protein
VVTSFDCATVAQTQLQHITRNCSFIPLADGIVHGVGFWFDVDFNGITLSCHPSAPPTHWKQTVVMLGGAFPVRKGEPINLQLTFVANADNPRHYQISVELATQEEGGDVDRR